MKPNIYRERMSPQSHAVTESCSTQPKVWEGQWQEAKQVGSTPKWLKIRESKPTMSEIIQVLELFIIYIYIFKSNLARYFGGDQKKILDVFFQVIIS